MSRMGQEISRMRQSKGMTQKQLAKLVGVSEGFIAEVESGRRVLNGELVSRITRLLGKEEGLYDLYDTNEGSKEASAAKTPVKAAPKPIQQVWSDALGSILKIVPVFDYSMAKAVDTRQLPIVSNKVEGYPKDKVFYLKIEDQDMSGFRIAKGDLALAVSVQEIDKDAIFFIEHNGKKVIRQVKKLEGNKLLLVSNKGSLITETTTIKSIKVLARLIRLEINL